MKQKLVVKVQMNSQECRSKALKIGAGSHGIESMSIEGQEKDQVVVIGEGVDPIRLTTCLRKKFGQAELISVDEVKPKPKPENQQPAPEAESPTQPTIAYFHYEYPQFQRFELVYAPEPTNCCQM